MVFDESIADVGVAHASSYPTRAAKRIAITFNFRLNVSFLRPETLATATNFRHM